MERGSFGSNALVQAWSHEYPAWGGSQQDWEAVLDVARLHPGWSWQQILRTALPTQPTDRREGE